MSPCSQYNIALWGLLCTTCFLSHGPARTLSNLSRRERDCPHLCELYEWHCEHVAMSRLPTGLPFIRGFPRSRLCRCWPPTMLCGQSTSRLKKQRPVWWLLSCFPHYRLPIRLRVIVTPAVYPRLVEFLHFDIQSTGQKSPCVNIVFRPSQSYVLIKQSESPCPHQF